MEAFLKFVDKIIKLGKYVGAGINTLKYAKKEFTRVYNEKDEEPEEKE
jgi:hypothetical protein